MEALFDFLHSETVNLTLAGYFARAAGAVFARDNDGTLRYLTQNKEYSGLVKHIYSQSIADFLGSVLAAEKSSEEWMSGRLDCLKGVLGQLGGDYPASVNAELVLRTLLGSRDTVKGYTQVIEFLNSREVIDSLFEQLKQGSGWTMKNAGKVLRVLLSNEDGLECTSHLVRGFSAQLGHLARVLGTPPSLGMVNQLGVPDFSLGGDKLLMVELLENLLRKNNEELDSAICQHRLLPIVTQLFKSFIWSSFLHNTYFSIVSVVLKGDSEALKRSLIEDGKLALVLVALSQNSTVYVKGKQYLKGNLGHALRIGTVLAEQSASVVVHSLLLCEGWAGLIQTAQERNSVENRQLGEKNLFNWLDAVSSEEDNVVKLGGAEPVGGDILHFADSVPLASQGLTASREQKSTSLYSATFMINNATFEDFENMEYMANHYWKVSEECPELGELQ